MCGAMVDELNPEEVKRHLEPDHKAPVKDQDLARLPGIGSGGIQTFSEVQRRSPDHHGKTTAISVMECPLKNSASSAVSVIRPRR